MLKNYQELKVWQKSYSLCLKVYRATRAFPQDEKYGLSSQMRRSAVSIPSNIAEGYGRKTTLDYLHSLYIAYGSLCELQTQLLLAFDLGYYHRNESDDLIRDVEEVERMLRALMNSLKRKT